MNIASPFLDDIISQYHHENWWNFLMQFKGKSGQKWHVNGLAEWGK
jgi:hypothetical protein